MHLVKRLCESLLGFGWPRPETQQCYCSHFKSYEDGARYTAVYRYKGRIFSSHLLILSGRSRGLYLVANIAFRDLILLLPLLNLLCVMGDPLHHTGERIYGVDVEVCAVPIADEGNLLAILEDLLEVSFTAW